MKLRFSLFLCLCLLLSAWPGGVGQAAPWFQDQSDPDPLLPDGGSTRRDYIAIPAAAFHTVFSEEYENHGRYIKNVGVSNATFRTAVHLPYPSTVLRVTACFYDDSPANSGSVGLYSAPQSDTRVGTEMAYISSPNAASFILVEDTSIGDALVNNMTKAYWASVILPPSTGTGNDVWFCGLYIDVMPSGYVDGYLPIAGMGFSPWVSGQYYINVAATAGNLMHRSVGSDESIRGGYMAPVHLPHGTVLKELTVHYTDDRLDTNINFYLQRANRTGTYWNMASLVSSDAVDVLSTTDISDATIDNLNYSYWVFIDLPSIEDGTPSISVRSVLLEYEPMVSDGGYASISNAAFIGFDDDYEFANHGRWLFHMHSAGGGSANGTYVAAVNLPNGAIVKDLWAFLYAGSNTLYTSAYLVRTRLGSSATLAEVTGKASAPTYLGLNDPMHEYDAIDNSTYAYFVYWYMPVSASGPPMETGDIAASHVYLRYWVKRVYAPIMMIGTP